MGTQKKNILVLTYFSYKDALIQSYVLPYLRILKNSVDGIDQVYLFTIEQHAYAMDNQEWAAAVAKLEQEGIVLKRAIYARFGVRAIFNRLKDLWNLFWLIKNKKISYIHCYCTPAGLLGLILSKASGKQLIVDSFEPHADTMLESGTWNEKSLAYRFLFYMEKQQAKRANVLIACTPKMTDYIRQRYGVEVPQPLQWKPACVDFNLFGMPDDAVLLDIRKSLHVEEDQIIGICSGKLGGYYFQEELFQCMKAGIDYWGDRVVFLLLTSASENYIFGMAKQFGIDTKNIRLKFVNYTDVPQYLAASDFAINHTLPVPSRRYGTPIKDGEFWAMGLPVIIPADISDDSNIIEQEKIGYVLKQLSQQEYTAAFETVDALLREYNRKELKEKIRQVALKYRSFDIVRDVYKHVYLQLGKRSNGY